MQAMVGCADGVAFSVMGLGVIDGQMVLFSDYKREHKSLLRSPAILRAVLTMAELMRRRGVPTVALADKDEPDSDRLMVRLGFELVEQTDGGGLYLWQC